MLEVYQIARCTRLDMRKVGSFFVKQLPTYITSVLQVLFFRYSRVTRLAELRVVYIQRVLTDLAGPHIFTFLG